MRSILRPLPLVSAALALGTAAWGTAQTAVPKTSPFLPAPGSASIAPSAAGETIQFTGVSVIGPKTFVSLFDTQKQKSRWLTLGEAIDGMEIRSYDAQRDQIVLRVNGADKTLPLRKSGGLIANLNYTPPPTASFAPTPSIGAPSLPTPTMGTPVPPPTTPQAKAEQEARMLVSDLLEIGMAQRKAYEEAQKKAEFGKKKS